MRLSILDNSLIYNEQKPRLLQSGLYVTTHFKFNINKLNDLILLMVLL